MARLMYVVGIDPAPTSTGVAVRSYTNGRCTNVYYNAGDLVSTSVYKIDEPIQSMSDTVMFGKFADIALRIYTDVIVPLNGDLKVIAIEAPLCTAVKSPITWATQIKFYSALIGVLSNCIAQQYKRNIDKAPKLVPVSASQAKVSIKLKAHDRKTLVIPKLIEYGYEFKQPLKRTREDIADAIAVTYAGEYIYKIAFNKSIDLENVNTAKMEIKL